MISSGTVHALRMLPADFASAKDIEVCECGKFLVASRSGAESLVWRFCRVRPRWVRVSRAGRV